jgi:antitoxin component YwqK of YwqJK toxin-antitoxin module
VKIFHDNGNLYYEGFYKTNQKNGHGKEYHYNGVLKYEGNFINDQIDGDNVTIYFDTGQFYYIGKVKNGLFHDKGKISLYKNGEANDTHKKTLNPEYKDGFLHNTDNKIAYMSPGNYFGLKMFRQCLQV